MSKAEAEAGKETGKAVPSVVEDAGEASHELADIAERVGLFGAAKKLREYGQAIAHGARVGDQTAAAVLRAKNAYDQSALKRVVDALAAVAKIANARKSPLRRVAAPKVAKTKAVG